MTATELYKAAKAAAIPMDHWESDLYLKATPESDRLIAACKGSILRPDAFYSPADGTLWYEIPFAYMPWWTARSKS